MAISDVLFEAEEAIREYQRDNAEDAHDPEVNLALDVIRAVRMLPGRDNPPNASNTFAKDLAIALELYRKAAVAREAKGWA